MPTYQFHPNILHCSKNKCNKFYQTHNKCDIENHMHNPLCETVWNDIVNDENLQLSYCLAIHYHPGDIVTHPQNSFILVIQSGVISDTTVF